MRNVSIGILTSVTLILFILVIFLFLNASNTDDSSNEDGSVNNPIEDPATPILNPNPGIPDVPVSDQEGAIACGEAGSDLVIDFENTGLAEKTPIGEQYADVGITFRNGPRGHTGSPDCPNAVPVLGLKGAPRVAFAPNDTLKAEYNETNGEGFLTDTGSINGQPCQLIIDLSRETFEFSFEILDMDNDENWNIQAFDSDGELIDEQRQNRRSNGRDNARPRSLTFSTTESIAQIQVTPANQSGGWGLGFDNFRPYCIQETPIVVDPEINKVAALPEIGDTETTIDYTLEIVNNDSITKENVYVIDQLPSQTISDVIFTQGDGVYSADNNTINWNIGSMEPGATVTFRYTLVFNNLDLSSSEDFNNTAIVFIDENDDGQFDEVEEVGRDDALVQVINDQPILPATSINFGENRRLFVIINSLTLISLGLLVYFSRSHLYNWYGEVSKDIERFLFRKSIGNKDSRFDKDRQEFEEKIRRGM